MKQISSLVNFGILKNNIKRFYLMGILEFLIMFFALPFTFFINKDYFKNVYENSFGRNNVMLNQLQFEDLGCLCLFFICIIAFVLALAINRYLTTQNSTIFNHSLPVGKTRLYITNYLTGLILMCIPIATNAIILMAEKYIFSFDMYRCMHVIEWALVLSLCVIFVYTVTNTITMLTGSTVFAGLLSCAALSFEFVIGIGIIATLDMFVKGAHFLDIGIEESLTRITPFFRVLMLGDEKFSMLEIIVYVSIIIVLFALGLVLYKKRKNETATETMSFEILKPIFKYTVTFLSSLALGLIFVLLTNYNGLGTATGYVLGLLIGYFASEMIISQSIRVFHEYKGFLIALVVLITAALCIRFDIAGFERRIPNIENIKSADFRDRIFEYKFSIDGTHIQELKNTQVESIESIEKIVDLHKSLIKTSYSDFECSKLEYNDKSNVYSKTIVYELKNGKRITRKYNYIENENQEKLKALYEDDEYQYATYRDVFEYNKDNIYNIELENTLMDTYIEIYDTNQIDELLKNIVKDVKNQKYENRNAKELCILRMSSINYDEYDKYLLVNPKRSHEEAMQFAREFVGDISIDPTFVNTINWIKQNGYEQGILCTSKNVESAIIYKIENNTDETMMIEDQYGEFVEISTKEIYQTTMGETLEEEYEYVLNNKNYYELNIDELYDVFKNIKNEGDKEYKLMIKFAPYNIEPHYYRYYDNNYDENIYYELCLSKDELPNEIIEFLK